ncbi:MAG: hypothetical protein HY646_19155, partial [Acidobacteria bacterium]|nr:hypothetical protein [Acidobacteriota bacterium]
MKSVLPVLILLLSPLSAAAQTVLHFPRVISQGSVFTGLAVSNPTPGEVSVTYTAFEPAGTALSGEGVTNPVTVRIPAGGQSAKLFSDLFGTTAPFNGWVQATSSTRGVTGFFLNGNNALTDLDGAGSVEATADLVLALAAEDATTVTEITIVNPNAEPANATLTLYASDGRSLGTRDLNLPGRGLVRQTLRTLFANQSLSAASHVKVRSDRPVIAHEVVADFQVAGTGLR